MIPIPQFEHPLYIAAIIPVFILLLLIIKRDFVKDARRKEQKVKARAWMLLSRLVIYSLLVLAIAQPYGVQSHETSGDPTITVLRDRSISMDALDTQLVPRLVSDLNDEVPVVEKTLVTGNQSKLGDAILSALREDDNILLVSDGRITGGRSLGDMMVIAASLNATVHALTLNTIGEDAAVLINGPSITTTGEESEYQVIVRQIGTAKPYRVSVLLNDREILAEDHSGSAVISFSQRFPEGVHKIEARIQSDDQYKENNVYYKTVKVEPRPAVLLVTKRPTPWQSIFTSLYQTTTTASMQGHNLDRYSAVVLNDIPEAEIDARLLSDYVIDGNGLVVVGGRSSFDRGGYKDSLLEGLLPVQVGKGLEEQKTNVNIALLIDISGSTGSGFSSTSRNTVEEVEKALAIGVLRDLRDDDYVTIVAFNTEAYVVEELQRVGDNRARLEDRISRLTFSGGTRIDEGIKATRRILAPLQGSKNIILFSDGKSGTYTQDTYDTQIATQNGIKVYTVGVGEGTDREHLRAIAQAGNGFYFEPEESEKLAILFGEAAAADDSGYPLVIFNSHDFVTSGLTLSAQVSGFNQVVPKSNANLLVATQGNNPVLTTSRIGLGRVAAFSTDDGNGWAPELIEQRNSKLITKTVNWAVGDLSRKKEYDVHVSDVYEGQNMRVNVVADAPPDSELSFSKVGERLYTAQYTPQGTGYHDVMGSLGAVNYNLEYRELGQSSELTSLVSITGGQTFTADQAEEIIANVKEDSRRVITETTSYAWVFLATALAIFLFEVIVRRVRESKRNR